MSRLRPLLCRAGAAFFASVACFVAANGPVRSQVLRPMRTDAGCAIDATAGADIVLTNRGAVHGLRAGASSLFLGIPYAAPPTGPRRLRPPESHTCWSGVLEATAYGNVCPQIPPGAAYIGDEDCLNLNVWSPHTARGLPVQVVFHGGGGLYGSSQMSVYGGHPYDAAYVAEHSPCVVVTVNVRLGYLGYLTLPALDSESPHHVSGNYALLDMIAALQWVHDNIAAFGGDPTRVTLRGMSSGAINSAVLMTSPLARGLFSRVILESPMFVARPTLSRLEQDSTAALARLHCRDIADVARCLRALPAETLVSEYRAEPLYPGGYRFGPNVDGYVFPKQILDAFASTDAHHHVPAIIGGNAHEGTTLFSSMVDGVNTPADYAARVSALYGDRYSEAIRQRYPASRFESPFYAMAAVVTDSLMTCPARSALRRLATSQNDALWRYFYTHTWSTGPMKAAGAGHQTQLGFTFHNFDQTGFMPTRSERGMADQIVGYFGRFAASGNPNDASSPWPRNRPASDDYLQFDDVIAPGDHIRTELCDFWDTIQLPGAGSDAELATRTTPQSATSSAVRSTTASLVLGACDDTNLNLFLPIAEARALVPSAVGVPIVTPLFGGDTTPLNIAHFHCAAASIGGRAATAIDFALVRFSLNPTGHYILWILTDSQQLQDALRSRGIDSHLVSDASLTITGTTWTTAWGGEFCPYSVVAHQVRPRPDSPARVDWLFSGSQGIVHLTGSVNLGEEFIDPAPIINVPQRSALRRFFDRSRGTSALTHRQTFELTFNPPR